MPHADPARCPIAPHRRAAPAVQVDLVGPEAGAEILDDRERVRTRLVEPAITIDAHAGAGCRTCCPSGRGSSPSGGSASIFRLGRAPGLAGSGRELEPRPAALPSASIGWPSIRRSTPTHSYSVTRRVGAQQFRHAVCLDESEDPARVERQRRTAVASETRHDVNPIGAEAQPGEEARRGGFGRNLSGSGRI